MCIRDSYGDTPVYVTPDGATLSYAELDTVSDAVAAGLAGRGVGVGDLIGLLLPSGAAYAVTYVAAAKIGAVTAGVNDRLSPPERRRCLEIAGPRLVIASEELAATTGVGTVEGIGEIVEVDAGGPPVQTLAVLRTSGADVAPLPADPDRPVAVVFTLSLIHI